MSAPADFHPGDAGFYPPLTPRRPVAVIVAVWLCLLLALAAAMVGLFVRLTHHHPRPLVLRGTLGHSWVPAPRSTERAFARLEQTEGRP